MNEADVASVLRDAMVVTLLLGAPPLLAGLVVGLLVSLLQAVTQINEATLAFVPKVMAIGATMVLAGSYMFTALADFSRTLFARLVDIGAT